jgi:arylsulfatase A-like enzyme/Flp pilus assembly protein TadD
MSAVRSTLVALVPAFLLFAACGPSDEPAPAEPPASAEPIGGEARAAPSIPAASSFDRAILVTIDTLRADHVGSYGSPTARTPTLDGLAHRGVRFEHAISPVPLTLPSHASLMTALQPPAHGVRNNSTYVLSDDVPVIAEQMRDAGFTTAAFVAAIVLDPRYGLARGFDTYDAEIGFRRASKTGFSFAERTADRVVDSALGWLADAPDHFFVWIHLYDPHADYQPPPAFELAMPGDPYGGEIAFADSQIGRFLKAVEARWPDGRTLVVATSDHGDALGEHGEVTHSYGIYDSTQRVPLIWSGAGLPSGVVVPGTVRLIDVAPTILSLAGAPPLPGAEGESLAPLWESPTSTGRVAYVETLATRFDMNWSPLLGIRTDDWKYIRAPRPELYDVRSDPGELENLYEEHPEEARDLDHLVDLALAETRPSERVEIDARQREQLESLGYVVNGEEPIGGDPARVGGPDPKDHMEEARVLADASVLLADGQAREALDLLESVEGGGRRVQTMRAQAAREVDDLVATERAGRALIELGDEVGGRVTLGAVFLDRGDVDAAESEFLAAYDESSREAGPLLGLARVAEERGDRAVAEQRLRQAMARQPSGTEARWRLAVILIETGREEEGHALLAELPADSIDKPHVLARLGQAEQKAGNRDDAIRRLAAAADGLPDNAQVRMVLIALLDEAGRIDEALVRREELYRLRPDDPSLQNNLAWYLAADRRDLDRALDLARRAVAGSAGSADVLDTLATVHLVRDEPAQALEAADRAIAAGGGDAPHIHYVRGAALAALGRRDEAREALARSRRGLGAVRPDWADTALSLERQLESADPADPSAG